MKSVFRQITQISVSTRKLSFWKSVWYITYPSAGIYLLKVNNRNTRKGCETCSKLTIKTAMSSGVFIFNFEYISRLVLVFLWLTLSSEILAGIIFDIAVLWLLYNMKIMRQIYILALSGKSERLSGMTSMPSWKLFKIVRRVGASGASGLCILSIWIHALKRSVLFEVI